MKNNKANFVLINLILLTAIFVICFLFSKEYTSVFWISLVITAISFIEQIALNLWMFKDKNDVKYYFFSLPATYLSFSHVFLQSIACLVFAIALVDMFKIGFAIQFLLLAIFTALILVAIMGKNKLSENDEERKATKSYLVMAAANISSIEAMAEDRELKAKLHSLYEVAKMSNPMVSPALMEIEGKIQARVVLLKESVNDKEKAENLIKEIKNLINERNNFCKVL